MAGSKASASRPAAKAASRKPASRPAAKEASKKPASRSLESKDPMVAIMLSQEGVKVTRRKVKKY